MERYDKKSYLVKHKKYHIRIKSRSGGVFTAVSDVVIDRGGVVYGCAVNKNYQVNHSRIATKEERNRFRGSKYVQSNLKNTFNEVKEDLISGKLVLYSGTGCQIAGLKSFLIDIDTTNLYTVDIVCHGVPSPRILNDFLEYM